MEAQRKEENWTVDNFQADDSQEPLAQEYHPLDLQKIQAHKQQRELSFFSNIAAYCLILMLTLSLCLTILPALIALPLGLIIPLGIILAVKKGLSKIHK